MGKHIITVTKGSILKREKAGCGECQSSCQSACKTSCTVGNQSCLHERGTEINKD
ncbi:MAG: six-cysteine peptide SCIFF [Peptococcaceae bacterium]|nr:six-cysteine peptide SCIFF [Peptococcaceae bacterium]